MMDKKPTPQMSDAAIDSRLRAHDITPTQQRVDIARILFARPQHLSADQVLSIVNQETQVVSKATIYNTLNLFARKGLVREVIVDPSKVFYDSNVSDHHHFYNVDSGELMDIDSQELKLDQLPTLPDGTEADGVDIIIRVRSSA
ncbi:Fur family transcriptional regulator [Thiohalophilus sp.]|uniref:Fur family transcriptional regulator n=1 Tax=Thiohalophilus sp. TaxID=3028392 RepID=UPI002ACEF4B6|nr:Fur family transcriptional regulator [Thiohalophilus sp.]MDZ7663687.1 Fur family transcriptional regulator [Thiohalophilus sp.]